MTVRLDLPREAGSVPTVRRLLRSTLAVLRVDHEAQDDLEIAITEACSNVVRHATGAEMFEVCLDVAENRCSIDVRDNGPGFDPDQVGPAGTASESGRGLELIKALGENVRMHSVPRSGSLIHFEKSFA
ncbi:ATP-binding protein [Actinoplanes sp. Pm04-4]|uniref:ATP-binding protein n=1 Tax=Paractinoplanes pyxinae TaxID=2997416 RepID=A0ABT4BI74_9ACTN|nr:ATP-binding protein [Actinoplanes pyxinae]MCY1145290.1 ATP-binding protein [Actinoplanes pyxinae]